MPTASTEYKEVLSKVKNELKHTAHSSYRCEYHVVFAPKYRRKVKDYIRNQLEEDYTSDQISLKEFTDPFAGERKK